MKKQFPSSRPHNLIQVTIAFPIAGAFTLFGLLSGGMGNALTWGLIGLLEHPLPLLYVCCQTVLPLLVVSDEE